MAGDNDDSTQKEEILHSTPWGLKTTSELEAEAEARAAERERQRAEKLKRQIQASGGMIDVTVGTTGRGTVRERTESYGGITVKKKYTTEYEFKGGTPSKMPKQRTLIPTKVPRSSKILIQQTPGKYTGVYRPKAVRTLEAQDFYTPPPYSNVKTVEGITGKQALAFKEQGYEFKTKDLVSGDYNLQRETIIEPTGLRKWTYKFMPPAEEVIPRNATVLDKQYPPGMPPPFDYRFMKDYARGVYSGIREKPGKALVITAAAFVLPPLFKGVGKLLKPVSTLMPGVSAVLSKSLTIGIPVIYGTGVTLRIVETPKGKRAGKLGEITSTELLPMAVGSYASTKVFTRVEGFFSTLGRSKVKTEALVPYDVRAGKIFPESAASQRVQYKLFMTKSQRLPIERFTGSRYAPGSWELLPPSASPVRIKPMMYHATGTKFWGKTFKVDAGASEFPGLYGSYGVSPYFLRISGTTNIYGGSVFNPYPSPGVAAIVPKGFVKGYSATGGKAFIPGVKTEVEAILPPGTEVTQMSKQFYFKWEGVRVPIDIFKTTGGAGGSSGMTINEILSSGSYAAPSSSIYNPTSFISSAAASRYSSRINYRSDVLRVSSSMRRTTSERYFGYSRSYSRISSYSVVSSGKSSPISSALKSRSVTGSSRIISEAPTIPESPRPSRTSSSSPINYLLPKFKGGTDLDFFASYRGPGFKPLYTPSLEAAIFNIRGAKPPKALLRTGLTLRPINI